MCFAVQVPWGFNGWSPLTDPDQGSFYFYSESRRLYGVRCTHQPSPWISDYGDFRINAMLLDAGHADDQQYSSYTPDQSAWLPYYWNATLLTYGGPSGYTSMEVTATNHGAVFRFNFPPMANPAVLSGWNQTRRILFAFDNGGSGLATSTRADGTIVVTGVSTHNEGNVPGNFGHHFYATLAGGSNGSVPVAPLATGIQGSWAFVDFAPSDPNTDTLVLRIATSLISGAQAQAAHAAEVDGQSFETVMGAAKAAWNAQLSRISVNDMGSGYTPAQETAMLTTFYSSYYRASKYPRFLVETNYTTGQPIHWSAYSNGATLPGLMMTDQGFWDAYRSTYSFLAIVNPSVMSDMMAGWLNAWREGGWVPQWSSPAYRGSMTGTMSDVSMAEAIVKLPHCGSARAEAAGYCVDAVALYNASLQNAVNTNPPSYAGRECLQVYIDKGYIPWDAGCDATVSRSMNYWHSDYAISQAASVLGYSSDAAMLLNRSQGWINLLEPKSAFMQPRLTNGSWLPTFDEFAWGPTPGYTEAGPWQYRVEVPYAPQDLKAALTAIGWDACEIVQTANTIAPIYHTGGYGDVIHEQTEMATIAWGQWEINNQPVWALQHMQVGFDTAANGKCANQAQYWLRKTATLFTGGADMFPGDEDNGSMGAWYIFNALGIYPLSPASGNYILGSPLFANVTIAVDNGATLTIAAVNQAPANVYVQGVTWNGAAVSGVNVAYADLMAGGVLQFTMGPAPFAG